MSEQQNPSLTEAVTMFISTLSPEQKQISQQELNKFIRWFGGERRVRELNAREIGDYGDSLSSHVTDKANKVEPVRSFLSFIKKKKFVDTSLAPHLRISKGKEGKPKKIVTREVTPVDLTPEGYAKLEAELDDLKKERPRIAEQLRHALADKDIRENAPLEAAKERQGQLEARIRGLEAMLKGSTIIDEKPQSSHTIGVGCTVTIRDLNTSEQLCYKLVSPSEANPAQGKLSIASPTGKALLDNTVGATVEVEAPAGILRYQVDDIKF